MSLAVITGASSGIGRDLAWLCAREGFDTLLVARSAETLTTLSQEITSTTGRRSTPFPADLSDRSAPDRIAEKVRSNGEPVRVLINNAGYGDLAPFSEADWGKLSNLMDLNMQSAVRLTYLVLPGMAASGGGRIMFVASTAAFQPAPYFATYAAAKSFILRFGQALSHEVRKDGISVTVLCPGSTRTGFHAATGTGNAIIDRYFSMESYPVAVAGFNGMMRGKPVVVPGVFNRINWLGVRFLPGRLAGWLAAIMMKPRG